MWPLPSPEGFELAIGTRVGLAADQVEVPRAEDPAALLALGVLAKGDPVADHAGQQGGVDHGGGGGDEPLFVDLDWVQGGGVGGFRGFVGLHE